MGKSRLASLALQCPAWCWGSRTPAPAPLSCSPLRRSVPRAAVPSGAVLGRAGGRAVAGISPGLCSELSRAKRINGERVRGNSLGAAADAVLSMLWQDFALLAHMLLLSLSVPSVNWLCPQCCHHPWCPQGCSPPRPAMPTAPFAAPVPCCPLPTLPACLHPQGRANKRVWLWGTAVAAWHSTSCHSRAQPGQGAAKRLMKPPGSV